jgi:chromosome segregation ATPase
VLTLQDDIRELRGELDEQETSRREAWTDRQEHIARADETERRAELAEARVAEAEEILRRAGVAGSDELIGMVEILIAAWEETRRESERAEARVAELEAERDEYRSECAVSHASRVHAEARVAELEAECQTEADHRGAVERAGEVLYSLVQGIDRTEVTARRDWLAAVRQEKP